MTVKLPLKRHTAESSAISLSHGPSGCDVVGVKVLQQGWPGRTVFVGAVCVQFGIEQHDARLRSTTALTRSPKRVPQAAESRPAHGVRLGDYRLTARGM